MKSLTTILTSAVMALMFFLPQLFAQSAQILPESAHISTSPGISQIPIAQIPIVRDGVRLALPASLVLPVSIENDMAPLLPILSDMINEEAMRRSNNHFESLRRSRHLDLEQTMLGRFMSDQKTKQSA